MRLTAWPRSIAGWDATKRSREGGLSYAILEPVGLPPRQIEQGPLDVFAQKTSAVPTNVLGPREPVYFAGSKIAGVVPWVPAAGTIGMGINIFSYNGGVAVGLQVDVGSCPTRTRSSRSTSARSRRSADWSVAVGQAGCA